MKNKLFVENNERIYKTEVDGKVIWSYIEDLDHAMR